MTSLRLTSLLLCLATSSATAGNWPQWRGPNNDGISPETNLPTEWAEGKNILWKVPLPGMGSSTPCIFGDKIFLTSESKTGVVAMCISTSGKELWSHQLGAVSRIVRSDEGNGASASPSTDGKHVWFFAGSGELACYDFDGKEIWKINCQEKFGKFKIQFGMHSTPALYEGKLYLQFLHDNGQQVICVDAATGDEVWKINRSSDGRAECLHSYASPFIWKNGKEAYLVAHGNDYATAHSLKDGSEIWRVGGLNPREKYNSTLRLVASPVCTPDLIVVPSAKGGPVVAVKPNAKGKVEMGGEFEQWRMPRGTPDVPSPLVHDGYVYLVGETGKVTCLNAKTGEQLYSERTRDVRHRASPVYADGKIYSSARDGSVFVLKTGPTFELLATNRLPDDITSSVAIADGRIYIRAFKALYAIGTK